MLRWLPTLWLGFVVVRYGKTSVASVLSPYNPGWDTTWAIAWLAFMLCALVSLQLLGESVAIRIGAGLLLAGGLAILVLSSAVVPAILALTIFAIAAGLGEFALHRLHLDRGSLIERLVLTVPIGVGALALGQLALALLGLFNTAVSWLLMAVLAVPAFFGIRELLKLRVKPTQARRSIPSFAIGYIFLLNLTWAVAPEIQYDSLNVHLAVPRLYLQSGGLVDLPYFFNSYFAHLLDMFFGLGLAVGGAGTAKFLVFGLGLLAAGGVFVLTARLSNHDVGVWAALLFYSAPLIIWSSSTAYLDLPLALLVTSSAVAFLRWHETSHWGWMAASGWIAGVAVGTKTAALATLIVFPVVAAGRAILRRSPAMLLPVSVYALLLLVVAVPWHAVTYAQTGNPFFPLLNGIFRSPNWPIENTILDWGTFGVGTSWRSLMRIPFLMTWDTTRFGTVRGAVSFAPLLVFPVALKYVWNGTFAQRLVLSALSVHMAVWMLTAQHGRYFISALPFAAAVGCAAFLETPHGKIARWNSILLMIGILAQPPIASVLFWNIPERFPIQLAVGRETPEAFLARGVRGYTSAAFLNTVWKPGEKILGVDIENSRFYFDGPLYTQHYRFLAKFKTASDLRDDLVADGFAYVVASSTALKEHSAWFGYIQPEFLAQFGEELFRDEEAAVFRIRGL